MNLIPAVEMLLLPIQNELLEEILLLFSEILAQPL
jgi:hypothetical protein